MPRIMTELETRRRSIRNLPANLGVLSTAARNIDLQDRKAQGKLTGPEILNQQRLANRPARQPWIPDPQ